MCELQRLRSACAYAQSDQSLCLSLEYSMSVKLLTEHHLELLSLKGGCTGSSESARVKMPHCWKSHVTAHMWKAKQYINLPSFIHCLTISLCHLYLKNFLSTSGYKLSNIYLPFSFHCLTISLCHLYLMHCPLHLQSSL